VRVRDAFADEFATVLAGVLDGYDATFGFAELSKVPGKKIRVELHREERPRPPHFAPQFPYHSTIDFPVASDEAFTSPTRDGKFLYRINRVRYYRLKDFERALLDGATSRAEKSRIAELFGS